MALQREVLAVLMMNKRWMQMYSIKKLALSISLAGIASIAVANPYVGNTANSNTQFVAGNAAGGNLVSLMRQLVRITGKVDQDVKNTNKIAIERWNHLQQQKADEGDGVSPLGPDFIWHVMGFDQASQLSSLSDGISSNLKTYTVILCEQDGGSVSQCQNHAKTSQDRAASPVPLYQLALTPQQSYGNSDVNQSSQQTASGTNSLLGTGSQNTTGLKALQQYENTRTKQAVPRLISSIMSDRGASELRPVLAYSLSQALTANQPQANGQPSMNSVLQQFVTKPFSNVTDITTGKTWLQAINTASSPQLLRSIAVMQAVGNYINYQRLRLAQTSAVVQTSQSAQTQHTNDALDKVVSRLQATQRTQNELMSQVIQELQLLVKTEQRKNR